MERLRGSLPTLVRHLRACRDERDVIDVLSNALECDKEVTYRTSISEVRVDIVCDDIAIEVELNRRPYSGLDQVIAYLILLGFRKAMIVHVVHYASDSFISAFRRIISELRDRQLSLKGVIISLEQRQLHEA